MRRPVLHSKEYNIKAIGSFTLFMTALALIAWKHPPVGLFGLMIMFIVIVAGVILWFRYIEWMQGHRETIWSSYEFDDKFAIRWNSPEALKVNTPIKQDLEDYKVR